MKPAHVMQIRSREGRGPEGRPITSVIGGLLVLLVAVLALCALAPPARAASTDLAVSFPAEPLGVEPGGTTATTLSVANVGKDPLKVTMSVNRVKLLNGGRTEFVPGEDPQFAGRVRIVPARFTVQAGRAQKVKVVITTPADLKPDNYFLGVLATPDVPAGQVRTVNAVGALVVLDVAGDRTTALSAEFVDLPALQWSSDVDATVRARNTGKTTLKFTTETVVSGFPAPRPARTREVPHLLPQGLSRDVPVHWSSRLGIGRYEVRTVLLYNKTSQRIGQVVLTRTVWIVSPWWLALPAGIIVLVVLLVGLRSRRMRRLRARRSLAPES